MRWKRWTSLVLCAALSCCLLLTPAASAAGEEAPAPAASAGLSAGATPDTAAAAPETPPAPTETPLPPAPHAATAGASSSALGSTINCATSLGTHPRVSLKSGNVGTIFVTSVDPSQDRAWVEARLGSRPFRPGIAPWSRSTATTRRGPQSVPC